MNKMILKLAVLSISILFMGAAALSPALADISAVFKDASAQTIMLLVSLPSMTLVLASLAFGKLTDYLSRRTLFFIGTTLFLIGGLTPYFMNDLVPILVMRGVLGLGIGVTFPLSILLITDFFEGDERNAMMGFQGVATNTGGMLFPLFGGLLCTSGWHNAFLAYLVGIVIFLFVAVALPEPAKASKAIEQGASAQKDSMPLKVYLLEFGYFLFFMGWFTFYLNLSMLVVGEKMGTAADAGFAATMLTIAGILAGLSFGKTAQIFKGALIPVGWLVTGIGMGIMAMTHDLNVFLVGSFIAGFAITTNVPAYFVAFSVEAPPSRVPQAIALASVVGGIGQFILPFVLNEICGFFGQGPGRFPFLVSAIVLLAFGGLTLVLHFMQAPKAAALSR